MDYEKRQKELLEGIHPSLASVLSSLAWQRGHASGEEEVLMILAELIFEFREVNNILITCERNRRLINAK